MTHPLSHLHTPQDFNPNLTINTNLPALNPVIKIAMAAASSKAHPSPKTLSLFLAFFFFLSLLSLSHSSGSPTVFEILPQFGLPSGLLPSSVQSYTLDDDGSFVVELDKPCYLHFDYLVYYDKSVTGKLRYGSISELKGIQVKKFFLWLDVDEIKVDLPPSDSIYFQVGLINKKLDLDQFKTVRSCQDGSKVSCSDSFKDFFKLPPSVEDEIPMLLTE